MFRIRQVANTHAPVNRAAIVQVQEILRQQFPLVAASTVDKVPEQLDNPLKHRFRSLLLVADDWRGTVQGFALCQHDADLGFVYLDFLAAGMTRPGRGIGAALYERVRETALSLGTVGVFFECLPDDPALSRDAPTRAENERRLAFYERYGARPIAGTAYETPLTPTTDNPPYLVFDGLGRDAGLPRDQARRIVRAILERKYPELCSPAYVEMVVDSFRDDPVRLRPPRYAGRDNGTARVTASSRRFALVVNDRSHIHHVRERGYVESPARIVTILRELDKTGLFDRIAPIHFGEHHLKAVHEPAFVDYLRTMCTSLEGTESVYPYVFPIRNATRPPKDLAVRAGYYCIDTFTPLNHNAFPVAVRAVDCALTAAQRVLEGAPLAYALVRPPGHHAERRAFGGFCYLNSTGTPASPTPTSRGSRTSAARAPARASTSTCRSPSTSTRPATGRPWPRPSAGSSASPPSTWSCSSASTPPRGTPPGPGRCERGTSRRTAA
jgi:GNAT superfamily N-acetyltransferase